MTTYRVRGSDALHSNGGESYQNTNNEAPRLTGLLLLLLLTRVNTFLRFSAGFQNNNTSYNTSIIILVVVYFEVELPVPEYKPANPDLYSQPQYSYSSVHAISPDINISRLFFFHVPTDAVSANHFYYYYYHRCLLLLLLFSGRAAAAAACCRCWLYTPPRAPPSGVLLIVVSWYVEFVYSVYDMIVVCTWDNNSKQQRFLL